jgi:heme-degrading monooxygenase HmoA
MIEVVWEFVVKAEAVSHFQELYGVNGAWAVLFRRYPGFAGTRLLQDTGSRQRFLTVDSWESELRFAEMRRAAQEEYARLDAECENLTLSEREIGIFRSSP